MSGVERLREAVLARARQEAERIVREAEERARKIVEEARRRKQAEIEEARKRLAREAGYEARIAEARIRARHIVAQAKNEVLEELRRAVISELQSLPQNLRVESLKALIAEALTALPSDRFYVYVSPRDRDAVKTALASLGIEHRVIEIREANIMGGVILESEDGMERVDNSYDTRLDTAMRRMATEIGRRLFEG